jgi:hypothetical protein
MSKKRNKHKKEPDISFSDKELNIISVFGIILSGIAYLVYGWPGLIGGAVAGVVMGVFFIRWYRDKGKQENQNGIRP